MKHLRYNIIAVLLLLILAPAEQAASEQLTDAGNTADFPDVRTDASGNYHLVWHDADVDGGAIFYRMFNSSGNVIIDSTQINNGGTGQPNTRPAIVLDNANRLFVVWENRADGEVYLLRLEPLLDDLDGSAADPATIKTLDDTRVSSDQDALGAVRPRIAADSAGALHIVWEDDCGPNVQYVKLDGDGLPLNGPVLLGGAGSCNDRPDIALDSASNVHVVFSNTGTTAAEEIYYAMLDGTAGTVLIDSTLLTNDDGLRATHATLGVDPDDDRVYVVYGQVPAATPAGGEQVFMATLDPSLDDRDGSVADPAVIRLSETLVSSGSPQSGFQSFARFGFDRRMHVTYMDIDAAACGPYSIFHAHVTTAGKVLALETLTASGAASAACEPEARLAAGGSRIVWTENLAGALEIFSSPFSRADAGESGYTCSLARGGSAWHAGDFWLLLAGLAVLGIWRRRMPVR